MDLINETYRIIGGEEIYRLSTDEGQAVGRAWGTRVATSHLHSREAMSSVTATCRRSDIAPCCPSAFDNCREMERQLATLLQVTKALEKRRDTQSPQPSQAPRHWAGASNPYESGHQAGYLWAERNDIDDPLDCGGNSQSFIAGCEEYAEEQEAQRQEEEEEQEQLRQQQEEEEEEEEERQRQQEEEDEETDEAE